MIGEQSMAFFSTILRWTSAKHIVPPALVIGSMLLFSITAAKAGTIPDEMIRRSGQALAADMVVSAESLIVMNQKGAKPLFIDVRNARAFNALHIAGAMNIPLHFVKTKTYLKSSTLVLVDQGLSFHRLSPACRELRKMGFNVRILDGGMNAWSSHGGPMTGEPVRQMDYCRISPADFFQEKNYQTRIICDVSSIRSDASRQLMPYALHLPLTGDPKSQSEMVEKFKSSHARGRATIIVVNTDGDGYRDVKHLFERAGFKNVFYLDGGIDAYGKYLEGLALSWRPREQRMATNGPCKKCGESGQAPGK
jgi:rhodanese-related sulfurtransferase